MAVATTGPSAAFFDLDRTLIAGSSVFALAAAARAQKLMPTRELARDALSAATFKLFGAAGDGKADGARARILGLVKGVVNSTVQCLKRIIFRNLHRYWSRTLKINTRLIVND